MAWCKSPEGMLIADEFDAYLDLTIDDAIRELVDRRDRFARIVVATRKRPQELERWALAARRMMPPLARCGGTSLPASPPSTASASTRGPVPP